MPRRHPTVSKVVAILETVASDPDASTVSALARVLRSPKSTVHTLVQGLLATDYLQERGGRLRLGPGIELLTSPLGDPQLQRLAHEELVRLVAATGETAQLAMRLGTSVVVLDQVQSDQVIRYAVPLRSRRPLLTTSAGKLFLADLDEDELRALLEAQEETSTPAGRTIAEERGTIRERGVAYNLEESVAGVAAASTPVRGGSAKLVAALVVAGPAVRVRPRLDAITEELQEAASRLSARLVAE